MSTPTVTEVTRRPEPVDHDTFIDELTTIPQAASRQASLSGSAPPTRTSG